MTDPNADPIEITQFTCPNCGGHTFGQTPKVGGMCHGYRNGRPCNFRFKFDDPRYFKGTGKFMPRTISARSIAKA